MEDLLSRITINSDICNGKPTIRNSRITVTSILEFLSAGESKDSILENFPFLVSQDIDAAIYFASKLTNVETKSIKVA